MGSREHAVMGLESPIVSAQVIKHFVTITSKAFILTHLAYRANGNTL